MGRRIVEAPGVAAPRSHYSHGVVGGGWLYVAGQVAMRPDGTVVEGDAAAQTVQILENMKAIIEAAGATMDDVLRTTVYLLDVNDRGPVGQVREQYFSSPPPANTLLVVAGLADPRYLVEIDAIVVLPEGSAVR